MKIKDVLIWQNGMKTMVCFDNETKEYLLINLDTGKVAYKYNNIDNILKGNPGIVNINSKEV